MTWIKGNWSHSGRAHARTNGEFTVRCAGVWRTRPLGIATDDGRGPRIAELCGYAVIGRIVLDIGTNRLTSITKTDQGGGHEIAFVPGGASYPGRERLDEILTPSARARLGNRHLGLRWCQFAGDPHGGRPKTASDQGTYLL